MNTRNHNQRSCAKVSVLELANKGNAGIDGVTFEAIETGEGIAAFLAELEEALKSKTTEQFFTLPQK